MIKLTPADIRLIFDSLDLMCDSTSCKLEKYQYTDGSFEKETKNYKYNKAELKHLQKLKRKFNGLLK